MMRQLSNKNPQIGIDVSRSEISLLFFPAAEKGHKKYAEDVVNLCNGVSFHGRDDNRLYFWFSASLVQPTSPIQLQHEFSSIEKRAKVDFSLM